jgi:hypothetical protein
MQPARQSPTFEPAQARSLKQTGPRSAVPRFGNRRLAEHRPRPATGWLVDVARDKCPAGQPTPTPQDPAPAFTQKVPARKRETLHFQFNAHHCPPPISPQLRSPIPPQLRSPIPPQFRSPIPPQLRSPIPPPTPLPDSPPNSAPRFPPAPLPMGLPKTQKCKAAFCIPSAARAIIATHGVARDSHY